MPRRALVVLLALLVSACVVGDPPPEESALEAPRFDPDPDGEAPQPQAPSTGTVAEETDTDDGEDDTDSGADDTNRTEGDSDGAGDGGEAPPDPSSAEDGDQAAPDGTDPEADEPEEPAPILRSRVSDPRGDTESTRLTSGPDHTDLVGGQLVRHPQDGYRLEVELDGGAPEHARDGDHTMNVASFYDLTGDGHVDIEVWANLADGGWDTARFDNRRGEAAFSDDDEATVGVEDGRLVLRFPLSLLDGGERLRWAVASEWGRYDQLGTPLSVRDEMPDDGAPAPFPG